MPGSTVTVERKAASSASCSWGNRSLRGSPRRRETPRAETAGPGSGLCRSAAGAAAGPLVSTRLDSTQPPEVDIEEAAGFPRGPFILRSPGISRLSRMSGCQSVSRHARSCAVCLEGPTPIQPLSIVAARRHARRTRPWLRDPQHALPRIRASLPSARPPTSRCDWRAAALITWKLGPRRHSTVAGA